MIAHIAITYFSIYQLLAFLQDDEKGKKDPKSRIDLSDPLHLNIGLASLSSSSSSAATSPCPLSATAGSASPTRPGRQCFSPSLQQSVYNSPFTPSPSKQRSALLMARRSLSPIIPRSSPLRCLKRKCDSEDEFATPSKRLSIGVTSSSQDHGLQRGLLITQCNR